MARRPVDLTASIIVIGNEILTGKVVDGNSPWLLKELFDLGVVVRQVLTVPDEVEVIAEAVRAASERSHVVLTSGGVGPTHDDVTMAGVAAAFEAPLVEHPELLALLRAYFGEKMTPAARRMALLPDGARLISRPGIRYPQVAVRNVYIFPGVPEILRLKFSIIRDELRCPPWIVIRIYTQETEDVLAARLENTLELYPGIDIGSYPRFDTSDYKVMLTLQAKDRGLLSAARDHLVAQMDPGALVRVEE